MQHTDNILLCGQIAAGVNGRKRGHRYENILAAKLNALQMPFSSVYDACCHVEKGSPEVILLNKILHFLGWKYCSALTAYATGRLATAESGDKALFIEGIPVTECKSDVVVVLEDAEGLKRTIGISVKQCNNTRPTNAQVFFSTAQAFWRLVTDAGFVLSDSALKAMKQFCGDVGYRPVDCEDCSTRKSTPDRYFWEETDRNGRAEWEQLFTDHQDAVTRLLLQKGYADDMFPPQIIFHKTRKAIGGEEEIAIFSMDEFISLSHAYSPFCLGEYRVRKGSHKEPLGIIHQAPRFGVVQMQRGGQKQHPTQLQFNLKAGYFYHSPFCDALR